MYSICFFNEYGSVTLTCLNFIPEDEKSTNKQDECNQYPDVRCCACALLTSIFILCLHWHSCGKSCCSVCEHVRQQGRPLSSSVRAHRTRVRFFSCVDAYVIDHGESGGGSIWAMRAIKGFLSSMYANVLS